MKIINGQKVVRVEHLPDGMSTRYHLEDGSKYMLADASSETFKKEMEETWRKAGELYEASQKIFRMQLCCD